MNSINMDMGSDRKLLRCGHGRLSGRTRCLSLVPVAPTNNGTGRNTVMRLSVRLSAPPGRPKGQPTRRPMSLSPTSPVRRWKRSGGENIE